MIKSNFLNFDVVREEISQSNVMAMAEVIAFAQTRLLIGYMGSSMQKMFNNLCVDIRRKNDINYTVSDSYDLVQECALYLCEHYGEHLDDVIGYRNNGKKITVRIACIQRMMKLINRKVSDFYRSVSIENLSPASEPSVEIKEEVQQDYSNYDRIVDSLNLTENMRVALECRIKGLSYPEIGKVLERAQSTVFEYFIKMRQRYVKIYG